MRIALFGGSFDPPHRGHVAIACAAADSFHLDRVLFAPAGRQPLKKNGHSATFSQRLAMTQLACSSDARFEASTLDEPRADGRPNYTSESLQMLATRYSNATLYNLAGADSFQHLAQWHEAERLVDLAEWIVVSRPGASLAFPGGLPLTQAQQGRIHLLDSVSEDVAATNLRARLAAGDPCDDLLPPGVAAYIAERGLYRGQHAGLGASL